MTLALHACAEDREHMGVVAGEKLGGHCRDCSGADCRDRRRVHDRLRRAGLAVVKNDEAEMRVKTAGGVAGIDADFLQPEVAAIRGHQTENAWCAFRAQHAAERIRHFAAGQISQGHLHRSDALAHREELVDVVFIQH